jgi:hypothetical protein
VLGHPFRRWIDAELLAQKAQLLSLDLRHGDAVPAIGNAHERGEDELHGRLLVAEAGNDLGSAALLLEGPLEQVGLVRVLMRCRTGSLRCASDAPRSSARQAMAAG